MMNYWRSGYGKPLVLQHGYLGGSTYWAPTMAGLYSTFDIIAPDLPGFAGSASQPCPDSISGYAAGVIDLMDELKIDRFSIVGHSLGGMIALQLALDYPERIDRLVAYGTGATGNTAARFESYEESIARLMKIGPTAADNNVAAWFVKGREHPFFPLTAQAGAGFNIDAAIAVLRMCPGWDITHRLNQIEAPTLVVGADRDFAIPPEYSIELWKGIRDSQLFVAPGCSHNVHLEMADVFNSIVGKFLQQGG